MFQRIIGVFKLDKQVFAEIEHDESATTQAAIVVAIVAALSVIGTVLSSLLTLARGGEGVGSMLLSVVVTFVITFVNWFIWSAVTYFVGTKIFKGEADLGEMLRVIGFAYAPRMLQIIPCIGGLIGAIWALVASYFAIKEGLDLDNGSTIATVVIGWLATVIIGMVLGFLGLGGAVGIGALTSFLGQ
ncbi:MAG: YIP1 family protein [Anaerolineae bacterium]|nr:YIP1 family protein [Anaerolineae bacterium]